MRELEHVARDFAMQMLAVAVLLWPVRTWLIEFPAAPIGLTFGFLIGFGNALLWKLGPR